MKTLCSETPGTLERFLVRAGIEFHNDTKIDSYLTMGIGGTVRMVIPVYSDIHLKELSMFLQRNRNSFDFPYVLLGGGSNVIFADHSPHMIVIINRTSSIEKESGCLIKVSSGVFLKDLMEWNISNHTGGMDFLAGIPGTVGGAAAVNAGAFGQSISSLLEKATIVTQDGEVKTVNNDYFGFTYRDSSFKYSDEIILDVSFRFTYADNEETKKKVEDRLEYRKKNHPCSSLLSAGCFFKNPIINGEKIPAGRLIENLGLKGTNYKHLRISEQHANFVINRGDATFDDVKDFETDIVQKVLREKGIKLEREVIYISPDGKKY
jgi:UDP-N-acetylmuramate dehydrogenase